MALAAEGKRIRIRGTVQGVGFRPWVYRLAIESGIRGRVRNDSSGVTIDAFGDERALGAFEHALQVSPPPAARIADVDSMTIPAEAVASFVIVQSEAVADRHVSIPPDLATCEDCVRDILDPANRRYRYAFTNCTNCGPRFTIATDAPYDRAATTMAPFAMCEPCRHEYDDVCDRRFHAQPTACPECGPALRVVDPGNQVRLTPDPTSVDARLTTPDPTSLHAPLTPASTCANAPTPGDDDAPADPIADAARAIATGLIVALKGIGGFHLACDATSEAAVSRLRARKHRDEKPLAVMVDGIEAAALLAELGPVHRALLRSPERPIVLADRRPGSGLAASVAPANRQVGLMLPYSPLHHLLLADVRRPLVMTSGNRSDEPIAFTDDDAVARLADIADLILLHNRVIHTRCDDSVVAVVADKPMILRRSRGYVPRAVALSPAAVRPILATGALLKNTFCLAAGHQAYLGPHIGDLENLDTFDAFTAGIERFQRFVDIRPDLIACDMHPDYLSTIYAGARSEPVVRVQHHHAHVAAVMAEHRLAGPVIGLAYDGTGYGTDGTSWGGEVLLATAAHFERLATFRPLALAGGDRAIREPWRVAIALLLDAYDGALPPATERLMRGVPAAERETMVSILREGAHVSLARGVGRYFDGFGALFLNRRVAAYEGQVALEWNQAASPSVGRTYPFDIDERCTPIELDLRPTVRAAVADAIGGIRRHDIAAAFHNTIAAATAALVARVSRRVGRLPVVAGGGCFQNARLAESVGSALGGFDVRLPSQIPPGDGGIALGQAVVANAMAAGGNGQAHR
ncbi:MAG TPA: carbamoyltransferase HypF [Vicinamibacterales bacterium]|nr:carbamoyltransferase HypF [Vicinamibacterales bacterium]